MNTPTPRTDAEEYPEGEGQSFRVVSTDFARTLERELTAERDHWQEIAKAASAEREHNANVAQEMTAERDELRAEVERFKGWLSEPQALHAHCLRTLNEAQIAHLFGERMTAIVNRAERAEASLHAMRLVCGTTDADKFTSWVDRANARAEKAEADLAAAKERLRSEAMDDYASIKDLQRELATEREKAERYRLATLKLDAELAAERARLDWLESPAGFDWQWHSAHSVLVRRAAIDAAMKEGAK
jgi:hypothetical protein